MNDLIKQKFLSRKFWVAEAILPAIGRRRVQIVEGSTDIAIEEFPE